jgi:hypothetical protein
VSIDNADGKEVFRIIVRETGDAAGSYSRSYHDEYDFRSVSDARNANCHGIFRDPLKYKVSKYRVHYELIEDDVPGETDPPGDPIFLALFGGVVIDLFGKEVRRILGPLHYRPAAIKSRSCATCAHCLFWEVGSKRFRKCDLVTPGGFPSSAATDVRARWVCDAWEKEKGT